MCFDVAIAHSVRVSRAWAGHVVPPTQAFHQDGHALLEYAMQSTDRPLPVDAAAVFIPAVLEGWQPGTGLDPSLPRGEPFGFRPTSLDIHADIREKALDRAAATGEIPFAAHRPQP